MKMLLSEVSAAVVNAALAACTIIGFAMILSLFV